VSSSRKQTQHTHCVGFIARFAENLAINHDDGIGPKNKLAGVLEEDDASLLPCQAFRASARTLSG
jgi:hypothetical protein